ncbi:hypothetical protein DSM106972_018590 [Dulcicalothrix desertica PCC 7102]|uniref:Glycosyltransferase 2-like domain-containing protein n=1 Tax=Dulcicalothrix desertica PCC 7102 TaxID=232991 RepID=A0A433VND5_9CYAN|nr:glycosyltransferase [Dulcicalothrix desertica]RUT07599.1 hypothetical protein DSM106972_018590 [Dulcicalothrix desertica PCC 7102]TWH39768.1 Glycosyltransferase [Dulcicalothrix desertica PCC 7102]
MTDKLPQISIIVPSFNQGKYLSHTLESIFCQEYPFLEVIVMDGGSTDNSVEIIRSYESKLKYWQSQPDGGQSAAINAGIKYCTGEIVAWLNSDDYYWSNCLWTVAHAYQSFPERGIYIGNGLRYDQARERYTPFSRRHLVMNREALRQGLDYILQPSVFFLRDAWNEVKGLNDKLRFCMDWDILIRISEHYPVVLINEFLSVSREYEETKTSTGKLKRAFEIVQMIQGYCEVEATPGSLYYMLETLLDVANTSIPALRYHVYEGIKEIRQYFAQQYGNEDGFPETGDLQDSVYLPIPIDVGSHAPRPNFADLPFISIIVPSFNQAEFLSQTLESIINQGYPKLEILVFDGGSCDGSVDILRSFQEHLTYWKSQPDNGPADAINQGFAIAKGDIIGWLNSDDMLAHDALWEVAQAFIEKPELDMVLGNALYIDEENKLQIVNHGCYRTGLYYGEIKPTEYIPLYWEYVHAVPQPTVYFKRHLLETCGKLNESYNYIFDFELFYRFTSKAKFYKLERTQAFYRIHATAKTSDWNKFLIELYSFSRPFWHQLPSFQFKSLLRDYVGKYMLRNYGTQRRNLRFWAIACLVALSTLTKIGNPEAMQPWLFPAPKNVVQDKPPTLKPNLLTSVSTPQTNYNIDRSNLRYFSVFCSFFLPCHPGYSGGEIRDFHLIRQLLTLSKVDFFAAQENSYKDRENLLLPLLENHHTVGNIAARQTDFVPFTPSKTSLQKHIINKIKSTILPFLADGYHQDVTGILPIFSTYLAPAIQETLEREQPDFFFVSPQLNPVALNLKLVSLQTRLILASYDVEWVRIKRLVASQKGLARLKMSAEIRRAASFEKENLANYDGIIAVSELDKQIFVKEYRFAPERILVVENGVDPQYFSFNERLPNTPPNIIFVGSFSYLPNQQAAWRLIRQIMPLVRKQYPNARLWIVGQYPDTQLIAQHDGRKIIVTGKVEDVRPYLAQASVLCVPLISGSGTKYKILEALSAGVPTVCTPLAQEGLNLEDGKEILVGKTDQELAARVIRLLNNPELAATLASSGRQVVEQQYTWDSNLKKIDDWLEFLKTIPRNNLKAVV